MKGVERQCHWVNLRLFTLQAQPQPPSGESLDSARPIARLTVKPGSTSTSPRPEPANAAPLQDFKLPVSRPFVDAEIAVEREDSCLLVDLGASDETCIGE